MDRLICGDVGYGKTEVAIRAAFKAVMSGKQAAVLVPTTILAQQHLTTFTDRLAQYPVEVDVLSRFRTGREQQEILDRLEAHFATFPGYLLGFRYRPTGNPGEIGRIALWRSHADPNHAAQDDRVISLRAQLNMLIHSEHIERVLEIEGTPQNLPGG